VASAVVGGEIAVAGGFLADGSSSARVDLYRPQTNTWRRAPDLPVPVNHAAAATLGGRLVVVGGYGAAQRASMLDGDRWRPLPALPSPRAAAGAATLGARLYVVGGRVGDSLARNTLAWDGRRWSYAPGPTPREHLAAIVAHGRIYAVGGRTAGFDTNLALVESWAPGERRWRRESPLPEPRGGTGAAAVGRFVVSVGGEAPSGTLARVFRYDVVSRRWTTLPSLPTPRHGLAVAAVAGTVYAIAGGTEPGLHVSGVNEALRVG
jgi:non-specific serine/threonine protein kinase